MEQGSERAGEGVYVCVCVLSHWVLCVLVGLEVTGRSLCNHRKHVMRIFKLANCLNGVILVVYSFLF